LCPFCDTPLPSTPTPTLSRLLSRTSSQARKDPRPGNPHGLKASLTIYAVFCQRHQFESTILPKAEAKGWPKSIDWDALAERIMQMDRELKQVVDRGAERDDSSIFWRELAADIRNKGSLVVGGLGEQFANFQKTQPGYYGEQGSMVIHQTLYNLFPLASFDVSKIAPLTPNYFVEKVMVPEVALRLILQDQESSVTSPDNVRAALQTLRESASYGNTMFPVDGADWDVDSSSTITSGAGKDKGKQKAIHGTNADDMNTAAERMVVERAKVRRREIEEAYAAESE
ncbi:RTC4-like domain-containing protein, partial [Pterulicium gracile]